MVVHFGIDLFEPEWAAADVCIGTFDGVHLGHQQVVRTAVQKARAAEKACVLVTFDRHPAAVLAPHKKPPAVATLDQNLRVFRSLGVPVSIVLHFDEALASVTAQKFLEEILIAKLRADEVVIGHDFAMGKGREGDTKWLADRIATTVVPPFELSGQRVSSTSVRYAIAEGDVVTARSLLGRPFAIQGVVVPGQKLGRQLGFPTINIARSSHLVDPANGIYAGWCRTEVGDFAAAASIGVRPAVGAGPRTTEAYLIDFPGNELYGSAVELYLLDRLRDEQHFESLERLKDQIELDVQEAARVLSEETDLGRDMV
jgi:riboflavin kinase/FMN adenylyltransferase